MGRVSCLVFLAAIGCRANVEPEASREGTQPEAPASDREPSSTSEPPSVNSPAAKPEPEAAPKPEAIERQFDWSVPACPLTYRYHAELGTDDSAIIIEFNVIMSARDAGVSLHPGEIKLSQTLAGKPFGNGSSEPEGWVADVHLERRDGVWTEIDGVTMLWSALDSAPPLMLMWPALPAQRSKGATAAWTFVGNHDNPEVVRTEFARRKEALPDDWEPGEYEQPSAATMTVTLESWEGDGADAKAILVVDDEQPLEGEVKGTERMQGRYEVDDGGRLVRADVTIELRDEHTTVALKAELSLTDVECVAEPGSAAKP